MSPRVVTCVCAVSSVLLACGGGQVTPRTSAGGASPAPTAAPELEPLPPPDPSVPLSAEESERVRKVVDVYSDGAGHYVAVARDDEGESHMFYGSTEEKAFFRNYVEGYGSQGPGTFSYTFVDPRFARGAQRSFFTRDGQVVAVCGEREATYVKLPEAEATAITSAFTFFDRRLRRVPYFLARDDRGVYLYVDRPRGDNLRRGYRIFRGRMGEMHPISLTAVASDVRGDVFSTTLGDLRLVIDNDRDQLGEATWIEGDKKVELVVLPLDDRINTLPLIFGDLGVYEGHLLGTPCDDL